MIHYKKTSALCVSLGSFWLELDVSGFIEKSPLKWVKGLYQKEELFGIWTFSITIRVSMNKSSKSKS